MINWNFDFVFSNIPISFFHIFTLRFINIHHFVFPYIFGNWTNTDDLVFVYLTVSRNQGSSLKFKCLPWTDTQIICAFVRITFTRRCRTDFFTILPNGFFHDAAGRISSRCYRTDFFTMLPDGFLHNATERIFFQRSASLLSYLY